MRNSIIAIAVLALVFVSGCKKDETTTAPPSTDVTVSSVSPVQGNAGTVVTITGTNFGTDKTALTVTFGSAAASIDTIIGGTQLQVKVPASAPIGQTTISVMKAGVTATAQFTVTDPVVGQWLSEGANVAVLLYSPPFNIRRIEATFNSNGSYTVVQTDSSGTSLTLTGTWTTQAGGAPAPNDKIRTITVNQSAPTSLTAEGIYEVTVGASQVTMKYEIAQTNPPLAGVTPPTPAGGFGSTSGGAFGTINIQTYVKQ